MRIHTALRGPVAYALAFDVDGRERLVAIAKQSYAFPAQAGGELRLLPRDEQAPLLEVDAFAGDPATSAPVAENDFAPFKPRCDVLVHGSCHSPGQRPTPSCEVEVRVGAWQKRLRVLGPRVWTGGIGGERLSDPLPFTTQPVSYAHAFGGTRADPEDPERSLALRENPIGVGYYPFSRGAELDGLPGPSCEAVDDPVRSPRRAHAPAALGPIGRSWLPRLPLAGTYDQRWLDEDFPFLPPDFRHDYFQSAPADQQIPWPTGGEPCVLVNLVPEGLFQFRLPNLTMPVEFERANDERVRDHARMDTLFIDAEARRVHLCWRASLALERGIEEVRGFVLGEMPPGWARARATGKTYYRSLAELSEARLRERLGVD